MKSYKRINQLIGLAMLALIFNACRLQPIQKVDARKHGGAANNHINIQQRQDIQASAQIINSSDRNGTNIEETDGKTYAMFLKGYQGSLTYGLTNKFALSSSFNYMDHSSKFMTGIRRNGDGYFNYQDYEAKAVSKDFKAAFHYYLIDTIDSKERWKFGQFYGAGFGLGNTISNGDLQRLTTENEEERNWIRGAHDSNYYQFFLHSNHSFINRIFDLSISNKIALLNNNLKAGQLSIEEKTTTLLWQPSVKASFGYKPVKLFIQVDWLKPLNKQFLNDDQYLFSSIGLQANLNFNKF